MSISRRTFLAGSAAAVAASRPAFAADYPNKPVRLVVGYTPGGATDLAARMLAEPLGKRLGQQVIVENRPGASQLVGMEYVVRSAPDGYTLMFASEDATSLLPFEKKTMPYEMPDAFTYISRVTNGAYMIACNPDRPYKTIQEFIAYGKANPGKLKFATSGIGTAGDVAALLLELSAGIKMNRVTYRGGAQALTDTIAGITDAVTQSYSSIAGHASAGKVRLMVWTGTTRNSHAPDVPTMTELGYPDATLTNWLGVLGPANLPQDIRYTLQEAIADCLHQPALKEAYLKVDFDPTPVVGDAFRQQVLKEMDYWKKFVEKTNLYID